MSINRTNQDLSKGGVKFDGGKLRFDLIPPSFLWAVADILTYGANKYSARNWETGMAWSRPFAALMRHMWAWWGGEDKDPETGKSHLHHAACNLAFLIEYENTKRDFDDRATTVLNQKDLEKVSTAGELDVVTFMCGCKATRSGYWRKTECLAKCLVSPFDRPAYREAVQS